MQDGDYEASGAKIVSTKEAFGQDIVLKVRPPKIDPEAGQFKDGARYLYHIVGHVQFRQRALQILAVSAACSFHVLTTSSIRQHQFLDTG